MLAHSFTQRIGPLSAGSASALSSLLSPGARGGSGAGIDLIRVLSTKLKLECPSAINSYKRRNSFMENIKKDINQGFRRR